MIEHLFAMKASAPSG